MARFHLYAERDIEQRNETPDNYVPTKDLIKPPDLTGRKNVSDVPFELNALSQLNEYYEPIYSFKDKVRDQLQQQLRNYLNF